MDQSPHHEWRRSHLIGWIGLGLVGAMVFGIAFGFFVMWLWNWLMPGLFGLKAVTYWQAVGLVILAHLLLGAPGHGHGRRHGHHGHGHPGHGHHFHHHGFGGGMDHYGEWWKSEGRQAFEAYVERVKAERQSTDKQ